MGETAEATLTLPEEDVYAEFCKREWCDGLPFVAPTAERVRAMRAGARGQLPDTLGVMPPLWRDCTLEKLAINAVMAGCEPAYFPVVVAAVQAMLDPAFNLYGVQATTHPVAPLVVVGGPYAQTIGMHSGSGLFGPGFRANATIGRAIRLILMNVGGGWPGRGDMATQGSPAKFAYAIAEFAVKLGLLKEPPKRATGWTPPWFQRHLLNARKNYENPGFAGDLIVFKSEQTPRGPLFDPQMGWRDTSGGHVIVHDARGGHLTMLSEPNAPAIAASIKAALETAS